MGQCIVKVAPDVDRHVVWSSIVDAPVSYSCTREQAAAQALLVCFERFDEEGD